MRISGGLVQTDREWPEFKKFLDGTEKALIPQHEENASLYDLFVTDSNTVCRCELFKAGLEPETWDQAKKDDNATWRGDFETNWKSKSNKQLVKTDSSGNVLTAFKTPQLTYPKPVNIGDRLWVFSHNLCDKSTWFADAVRVADESMGSGDGVLKDFLLAHPFAIDVTHGKISDEDKLVPYASQGGTSYKLVVKVDGVTQKERRFDWLPPGTSSSSSSSSAYGDREFKCEAQSAPRIDDEAQYEVDYHLGLVKFYVPPANGVVIAAEYFYSPLNGGSNVYVRPSASQVFSLTDIEAQFSQDLVQIDDIEAGVYMYMPQYAAPPAKFLVPTSHAKFRRFRDFINWSRGSFPLIPPIGGTVRGVQYPVVQLRFQYQSPVELYAAYGMELRFWTTNHRPLKGEYASLTAYGITAG
jgi:hypothetical protein